MIRVALVDDDQNIRNQLKHYMTEYEKEHAVQFNVTEFEEAKDLVDGYKPVYDVIFMDVQMEQMDGLKASEIIREQDTKVIIVFVTNMAAFAIRGYTVGALSYVVKPIKYIDFRQQLDKAVEKINQKKSLFIIVTINNEIMRLDVTKIVYFESVEHRVIIHMEEEALTLYSSLKKVEQQVKDFHFARCNSGFLVNLPHVRRVDGDRVLVKGAELPISRAKKKPFMNALADYIGGNYI